MTDSKKMIPLSELTLLDRFLFDAVMENEDIHKTILQIILGRDIALLTKNQTEKELRTSPLLRSIRMDVYAMDEEKIIEFICKNIEYNCIGDICMGRGLVGLNSYLNNKNFVGIELNHKRLSVLLENISKIKYS